MKAGTYKKSKYIPINVIQANALSDEDIKLWLPFHALTGSNSTSYFSGHSKKTALRVFINHKVLLANLGQEPLTSATMTNAEKFICLVYGTFDDTTDKARVSLFKKGVKQELLPPTSDAAQLHIGRSHLQAATWLKANKAFPQVPPAVNMGWKKRNGQLMPTLLTLAPIPESCMELLSCSCTSGCLSRHCKCLKSSMLCWGSCKCGSNCCNLTIS